MTDAVASAHTVCLTGANGEELDVMQGPRTIDVLRVHAELFYDLCVLKTLTVRYGTVRYGYPHSYHGAQGPTRRARTHVVEIIAHNKSNQKPSTGNGAFNARRDASMAQLVHELVGVDGGRWWHDARRVGRRHVKAQRLRVALGLSFVPP